MTPTLQNPVQITMKARIRKWGNSLAVRIPKPLAEETKLCRDAQVYLTGEGSRLVITPAPGSRSDSDLTAAHP